MIKSLILDARIITDSLNGKRNPEVLPRNYSAPLIFTNIDPPINTQTPRIYVASTDTLLANKTEIRYEASATMKNFSSNI